MTSEIHASGPHFVQAGDGPVLISSGDATLACACGNVLIQGYVPSRFVAVAIQCARCATITETPPLADGELPPRSAIIAGPSSEPRTTAMTVPPDLRMIGMAEMARWQALFQPRTPADSAYTISPALLDDVAATYERLAGERLAGGALPAVPTEGDNPFAGLRDHPLAWAVRHLRRRTAGPWACMEDAPTANAATHVTGFLHFVATWSAHPLFPAMVATAAGKGFSLHGLAPFAAAHCMIMMGNQIRIPEPLGYPGRIDGFGLATGPHDSVNVDIAVFDKFDFPFGAKWDQASLQAAVSDAIAAAQGRINLRNPGVLVLSPGTALAGFDDALITAIQTAVAAQGRQNRGLMAVVPVVLRLQPLPDPHAIRFGYGFFPVPNRHYRGESLLRSG